MMPETLPPAARPTQKAGVLIGGFLFLAVTTYLVVTSIGNAQVYYLTIAELKRQAPDTGQIVRVSGSVEAGSIRWEEDQGVLAFALVDEGERLPVIYRGLRPDMLRDEATAIAEGRLGADGVFVAQSLSLKCPSKYEAAATATAAR